MWEFSKKHTEAVKGVATLVILFNHLFLNITEDMLHVMHLQQVNTAAIYMRYVGRVLFAFLSAYGLAKSWNRDTLTDKIVSKKTTSWILRRYIKMMSGVWVVHALILICTAFSNRSAVDVYGVARMPGFSAAVDVLGFTDFLGTEFMDGTRWYITIAILIVICIPMIVAGEKKFGLAIVAAAAMVPGYIFRAYNTQADFIFPVVLGAYVANNEIIDKIHNKQIIGIKGLDKLIKLLLCITVVWYILLIREKYGYLFLMDGFLSLAVIIGVSELIELCWLKWLGSILSFVGKHSMNIFLTHTFVYYYHFRKFVFSFEHPAVIFCVLVGVSIIISLAIEGIKKLIRFKKLVDGVCRKIDNKLMA